MHTTIESYMTRYPHSIDGGHTVRDARKHMLLHGVRHLPVLRDGKLAGLLSERDVAFAERAGAADRRIDDILPDDTVYAVDLSTPMLEVADVMALKRFGSAVVLEGGEVAGIFTTVDACRALADTLRVR